MKYFFRLVVLVGLGTSPCTGFSGNYFQQNTFNMPFAAIAGVDSDAVGNLYVLALPQGTTTYSVMSFRAHGLEPIFSFDTGLGQPVSFAVEGSGIVNVLDTAQGIRLRRFRNTGEAAGEASITLGSSWESISLMSSAFDKANGRLYLTYQKRVAFLCLACLGCSCPTGGLFGFVNQYDLSGNLTKAFSLPGKDSLAGSCYTPSVVAADPAGNVYVADNSCRRLLKYSAATGTLLSDTPYSSLPSSFGPRAMWTDGDSYLYSHQYICSRAGCPLGVVKMSPSGQEIGSLAGDFPVGHPWDGRILYAASPGAGTLWRFVLNVPPPVPAQTAPLGFVVQHSSSAQLAWQPSSDADGDSMTYSVSLGTSPTQLVSISTTTQAGLSTPFLSFGTTYYWQVAAMDSYLSLPLESQQAPVVSFAMGLVNAPPGAFVVSGGTGTAVTRSTSARLSWRPASDPDDDLVVYDILWRPASQAAPELMTTTATVQIMSGLSFGATYYWSVRARDAYGAVTAMSGPSEQAYFPVFRNSPPQTFSVLSGSGTVSTRAGSQILSWEAAEDPDGDALVYGLFLSTVPDSSVPAQVSTATNFALAFQYGATYYWRVEAYDGLGGTTPVAGGLQAFLASFLNDPPDPLNLVAPFRESPVVSTMQNQVLISWEQVTTPQGDPITYTAYLGDSPGSLEVLARISQAQTGTAARLASLTAPARPQSQVELDGTKVKLTLTGLDYYRSYYMRIVASNPYGASSQTPLQIFSLSPAGGFPKAYNYPNPFSPSRGGTNIVFNAPSSGYSRATVSIYSETQDLLFEQSYASIQPGISQVRFDGRDRHGRPLYNGSYICRVRFEGPEDKDTFYLMVVK